MNQPPKIFAARRRKLTTFAIFAIVLCAAQTAFAQEPQPTIQPPTLEPTVAPQSAPLSPPQTAANSLNYRIGPGDVIDVAVSKNQILSRGGVRVSNDGFVQLPMLDEQIAAACKTEVELAEEIERKYKKYLLNPSVIVTVQEFNANPVSLIGAVNSPGRFQLKRRVRVLELLSLVNGPNGNAGETIQIIRSADQPRCDQDKLIAAIGSGEVLLNYPLKETLRGEDKANPFVQAGDVVRVVEAETRQAFVIGNVRSAQPINLKEPVTLTKALAMVGGTTDGAQTEKITITRQTPGTLAQSKITINFKEITKKKVEDVLLQPNDIVEVPGPSGLKRGIRDALQVIVPTVLRAPIQAPIPIP